MGNKHEVPKGDDVGVGGWGKGKRSEMRHMEARQGNVLWIMRVLQTTLALLNQMGLAGGEKLASQ